MTEPIDKEKCLNIADQCTATASNDITASILVDGGSGTLRELLNDAADAIRAGWRAQPTAEGGIKWQCGPLASGFTAPHPAAMTLADSQPAPDEIINMAREQGLPETEIEGVFRVNADDLCRVAAAILAARVPTYIVMEDAARYQWLRLALVDRTNNGKSHWFCGITAGHPEELDAAIDAARKQGGV